LRERIHEIRVSDPDHDMDHGLTLIFRGVGRVAGGLLGAAGDQ
jgi:hypothetical protein